MTEAQMDQAAQDRAQAEVDAEDFIKIGSGGQEVSKEPEYKELEMDVLWPPPAAPFVYSPPPLAPAVELPLQAECLNSACELIPAIYEVRDPLSLSLALLSPELRVHPRWQSARYTGTQASVRLGVPLAGLSVQL